MRTRSRPALLLALFTAVQLFLLPMTQQPCAFGLGGEDCCCVPIAESASDAEGRGCCASSEDESPDPDDSRPSSGPCRCVIESDEAPLTTPEGRDSRVASIDLELQFLPESAVPAPPIRSANLVRERRSVAPAARPPLHLLFQVFLV